ncbi:MAG: hypothetical protein F6K35_36180 [Okeania sp. SIO2H7]|nr:hypothetical protein [Okeania sp. SIO2H7]
MPILYLPDGWYSRYLVFRQRQVPAIIVEFLFPGEEYSLLSKPGQQQPVVEAQIFQTNYSTPLGIRYFVVFNPTTNEMQRFEAAGNLFVWRESINGHLLIKDFELILGTWFGTFRGMERLWLRWMTLDGEVIWTPEEEEGQ